MADDCDYNPHWRVVSDEGLVVRKGQRSTSQKLPGRLPMGAVVVEKMRVGDRLHFTNLSDAGPASGWVTVGKGLLEKMIDPSDLSTCFEATDSSSNSDPVPAGPPDLEDVQVLKESLSAVDEGGEPLSGWASLSSLYRPPAERAAPPPSAACAAETAGRRRVLPEELPPVEELEQLDEATLTSLLGFDDLAARHFASLPGPQKRKMIAEAKALLDMGTDKRLEELAKYQRAWPRGPFPEHAPPAEDIVVLPRGSCFPFSRHLQSTPTGPVPEWGLESAAGKAARTAFVRKAEESPEAQKEFLRSLQCQVECKAEGVVAGPGVSTPQAWQVDGHVDRDRISEVIVSKRSVSPEEVLKYFNAELKRRICLMDGSIAARLRQEKLGEAEYRGERFKHFKEVDSSKNPVSLTGNDDLLVLTKPSLILDIHKEYLKAGSDIIRTNTLTCNGLAQGVYRMDKLVYEMNKTAAQLAKRAAAEATRKEPQRPRFVAGALGPTPRMASLDPDTSWSTIVQAYDDQIKGLVDGGADILLLDGVTDSLNAKAAIFAAESYFERLGKSRVPLMIGASLSETGRTPSGQSAEAFCISVKHGRPLAVGVHAAAAPGQVKQHYQALAGLNKGWCHLCLAAGGATPEKFASSLLDYAKDGLLNFAGGDADSLPAHISAAAAALAAASVRPLPGLAEPPHLQLAGLEACSILPDAGVQIVGSQCTVMGSAKFKEQVGAYKATGKSAYLKEAIQVCVAQSDKGADMLDFNLDSDMTAGPACPAKEVMSTFLRMAAQEPKVARLPFMLCSCDWETVREGLKCVQGKSIVNGVTMLLGEEEFLRIAREVKKLGAALVVLAVNDLGGPASSVEAKVRICKESYRLLRYKLDFPPEDIIFDCQVHMVGLPEYAFSAINFIKAVGELKSACPAASFIGGLNNLSLPFRGLNALRDALHSVFLQHAIPKGLNLALTWPGALPVYTAIDAQTRDLCEELVLNESADGKHMARFGAFVKFRADSLTCLPVGLPSREAWMESRRWTSSAVRKEAREMQRALMSGRKPYDHAQQKTFLASLKCGVACRADAVKPEAGAAAPDYCRIDGAVIRNQLCGTVAAQGAVGAQQLAKYFNAELRKRVCIYAAPGQGGELGAGGYGEYFEAGCDICGTDTLRSASYAECKAAAQLAKSASAGAAKKDPERPCFVAGVLGPTSHSLSAPSSAEDPSKRSTTWGALVEAYSEQVRGLVDGGVDLLALEAVADTLNAKAAIFAIDEFFEQAKKERLPLLITVAVAEGGRTVSGQSIEAFLISVRHARPLAVGVAGPAGALAGACGALGEHCPCWCHASAVGDDGPEAVAAGVQGLADKGLLNFVGGCGVLPSQVSAMASKVSSASPRTLPAPRLQRTLALAGLDAHSPGNVPGLTLVGQRCSMEGSEKFKGLIDAYKYTKEGNAWRGAVELCLQQCAAGADMLDFSLDSGLLDSKEALGKLLRLCAVQPEVAKVPFVISSQKWSTIEEGLQSVQGKCVVNAISLVQGEEEFLRLAKACLRYGAAAVVVAVESPGEALTYAERVRVGQRAYRLLRTKLDFPAEDIIIDCSVAPADQPGAAKDFFEAVAELRRTCPSASFIGGPGNLSLPFRGVNPLREAVHSVFLYHAVPMGLNLAFVDPGRLPPFNEIEEKTRRLCDEVVRDQSADGDHLPRLESYAAYLLGSAALEEAAAATVAYDLPLAIAKRGRTGKGFSQSMNTLVQATGTLNASIFQTFGSKSHTALTLHKMCCSSHDLYKSVWFSSISAWMGQGGLGPIPGASLLMDDMAVAQRQMQLGVQATTVEWGAVGEIGLRRTIYGSRDVFAQFDLGQKLLSPQDSLMLTKALVVGEFDPYENIAFAYLDQTWQNTLAGVVAGSALAGRADGTGRSTFADL